MDLLDAYAIIILDQGLTGNHIYVTNMAKVMQEAIENSEKEES